MNSVVIALIVTTIQAKWTQRPHVTYLKEFLGQQKYSLSVHETQKVKFVGAFDVQVFKKSGIDDFSDFKSFHEVEQSLPGPNKERLAGCEFDQRRVKVKEISWIDVITHQQHFYSDLISIPSQNRSLLIRNDFEIFSVKLSFDKAGELKSMTRDNVSYSFASQMRTPEHKIYGKPRGFYDQISNLVYIITSFGAVYFEPVEGQAPVFVPFEIKQRSVMLNVYYYWNKLWIVAARDGVDVYSRPTGKQHFEYSDTIQLEGKNGSHLTILDIQFNKYQFNKLYLLDSKEGIHIITFNGKENILETRIPIEYALAFKVFKGSFLVAAETEDGTPFAVEILYDSINRDYFYNNFYLEDLAVHQILGFEDKAILIGNDAQVLIQQNIYHGFVDSEFSRESTFESDHVEHIEFMDYQEQHYLQVLTRSQLRMYQIKDQQPQIVCKSDVVTYYKLKEELQESYWVKINSTICKTKVNVSPFELCMLDYQFHIEIYQSLVTSEDRTQAVTGVAVVVVGLLLIFMIGFFLARRWRRMLQILEDQKLRVQNKMKYAQMQEQSIG